MITVQELADELGITIERLGAITGLKHFAPEVKLSGEYATVVRAQVLDRTNEARKPTPSGLTLETYAPHVLANEALEAVVHYGNTNPTILLFRPEQMAPVIMIAQAVVLADLVDQGIAPYAQTPGVMAEVNSDAADALVDWVIEAINAKVREQQSRH